MDPQNTQRSAGGMWALAILIATAVVAIVAGIIAGTQLRSFAPGCFTSFSVIFIGVLVILAINQYRRSRSVIGPLGLSLLLIIPVGLIVFLVLIPWFRLQALTSQLEEYRALSQVTEQTETAYLRGKLLAVDALENQVDTELQWSLPGDLRAEKPEEVQMVIWEVCREERIGSYGGRGAANVWVCQVTLYDRVDRTAAGLMKTFRGAEPPSASQSGRELTGPRPKYEIIDYLKSLPRKQ